MFHRVSALLATVLMIAAGTARGDNNNLQSDAGTGPIAALLQSGLAAPSSSSPSDSRNHANLLADFAAYKFDYTEATEHGSGTLKAGFYFEPGSTLEFDSLTRSLGERDLNKSGTLRDEWFVSGSELVPVEQARSPLSSRIGAGFAEGDPRHVIYSLGLASYLSPFAMDSEGGFSYKVCEAPNEALQPVKTLESPEDLKRATQSLARPPHLFDHVRTGDLWFAGTLRSIWNSKSASLSDGEMITGALTYALKEKSLAKEPDRNPTLSTTLTVSGTYCGVHSLGVDELGFEVRTPVNGWRLIDLPLYLSARYGTRNDCTFSFEGRF